MRTYGLIGLMLGLAACTPTQPPVTEAMVNIRTTLWLLFMQKSKASSGVPG